MPALLLIGACGGTSDTVTRAGSRGAELIDKYGCRGCHVIGGSGNANGPGGDLSHIGSRLSHTEIEKVLVDAPAPMPGYGSTPQRDRDAMSTFLSELR